MGPNSITNLAAHNFASKLLRHFSAAERVLVIQAVARKFCFTCGLDLAGVKAHQHIFDGPQDEVITEYGATENAEPNERA